jgi:hypothetical protein
LGFVIAGSVSFSGIASIFSSTFRRQPLLSPVLECGVSLIGVTFVGSILAVIARGKFPRVGAVASAFVALLIIAKAISVLSYTRKFQGEALTLWFVAVGVLGTIELHLSYKRKKASKTPIGFLILAVVFIGGFAETYYPNLKSSWGGGEGAVAVISFTKDFQSLPNGQVRVQVLQESNAGFYVTGPKGTRAVFIPRTAVSLGTL